LVEIWKGLVGLGHLLMDRIDFHLGPMGMDDWAGFGPLPKGFAMMELVSAGFS